jgi:hypothetical protein
VADSTNERLGGEVARGVSEYFVDYGSAASRWCVDRSARAEHQSARMTREPALPVAGPLVEPILEGLRRGAEYCAELVAREGPVLEGSGQQFFTFGAPTPWGDPQRIGTTNVVIPGVVWTPEQPTDYYVGYSLGGTPWCSSAGRSGSPERTTPRERLPESESLTVELTGLSSGTAYCAQLIAVDPAGTGRGRMNEFKTLDVPPPMLGSPVAARPFISALSVSPRSFAAARRIYLHGRWHSQATGAAVRYVLSAPATVVFTVRRIEQGRASKAGQCAKATRRNRRARRCDLAVLIPATVARTGAAGSNSFRLSSTFAGRLLAPGHYVLSAAIRGQTGAATVRFRTVR